MSSQPNSAAKVTVRKLLQMKADKEKIVCLTAYDVSFAKLLDAAGVDVVLVGDSLGMVMQGLDNTLAVTMDDMVYHSRCVAKGLERALLMVDMPFMSHITPQIALQNAGRLMKESAAHIVKLEGGSEQQEVVTALTSNGIPVCAHLGLQPQRVHKLGGYRVQGREADRAERMLKEASILEQAGADVLLLECVPAALATKITEAVSIPVIGIGAGTDVDGQILVLQDILGITPGRAPKFSKDFMQGADSIQTAIQNYVDAVKARTFPQQEHIF
ncbi:MAG: 3-methyl-2-oxobutanoate hydroxymethyltransferase [Gammaproteobacteria bacterium]|nr:3-methyl-2-oxobutanoate hydroxymethyltransferase [Gammaproteobacteria bacterium]